MALPDHSRNVALDLAEVKRRNLIAINQIAEICAGSRRELADSYALFSSVQRSLSPQTTKRRGGELKGPRQAKCTVTITKRNGVETLAINDVEPRGIADGNYTLTVIGEPTSRWTRDNDGWKRLG